MTRLLTAAIHASRTNVLVKIAHCLAGCYPLASKQPRAVHPYPLHRISLGRIFEPRKDEVTRGWRIIQNYELRKLLVSPDIVWIVKSGSLRLA
jgi:hypothetical protein